MGEVQKPDFDGAKKAPTMKSIVDKATGPAKYDVVPKLLDTLGVNDQAKDELKKEVEDGTHFLKDFTKKAMSPSKYDLPVNDLTVPNSFRKPSEDEDNIKKFTDLEEA